MALTVGLLCGVATGTAAAENTTTAPSGFNDGYTNESGPDENVVTNWTFDAEYSLVTKPAVTRERVFVASESNTVYGVDRSSQSAAWRYETDSTPNSLHYSGDRLYVGTEGGQLFALDPDTGERAWNHDLEAATDGRAVEVDGTVFVSNRAGNLVALNASTGVQQWEKSPTGDRISAPVVDNGTVYVTVQRRSDSSYDGRDRLYIAAHDTGDGTQQWELKVADNNWYDNHDDFYTGTIAAPVVTTDRLYLVDPVERQIHSVNRSSRATEWRYGTTGTVRESPSLSGGNLYVGDSSGTVYMLDTEDGTRLQSSEVTGSVTAALVTDQRVYVTSTDRRIYGYDAAGVRSEWRYETDGSLSAEPTVSGGDVFVASTDGHLYALTGRDAPVAEFNVEPWAPTTGSTVTLDAEASGDRGGTVTDYEWDLDGDGAFDDESGAVVTTQFTAAGDHDVRLRVTDDSGLTTTQRERFRVADAETWASPGFDTANTGYNPFGEGPTENVVRNWSADLPSAIDGAPIRANGLVYVTSRDGHVYAFDPATGERRWNQELGSRIRGSATYYRGTLYVGTDGGWLYALNATDGTEQWSYETGNRITAAPTVLNDSVYVSTYGGDIYRLDGSTGDKQWQRGTVGNAHTSGVTVVDRTVYTVVQWRSDSSYDGRDRLYVTAHGVDRGIQRWEKEIADNNWYDNHDDFYSGRVGAPVIDNGRVFAADPVENDLHALDATTGKTRWASSVSGTVSSTPAVTEGVVYVTDDDKKLSAFDRGTGSLVNRVPLDAAAASSPAVGDGTVYVGTRNGDIQAFSTRELLKQWTYTTPADVRATPTVADGRVYVGTTSGRMLGLGDTDRPLAEIESADRSAVTDQQIHFDASGSSDRGGTIDSYEWDFDGDGETEETGRRVNWSFQRPGERTVTLTVTDRSGSARTVRQPFTVVDRASWPTANFDYGRTGANPVGTPVTGPVTSRWQSTLDAAVDAQPIVGSQRTVATTRNGTVYAVNRSTGAVDWRTSVDDRIRGAGTLRGGTVYVGADSGWLYAIDVADGTVKWSYETGRRITAAPTVQNGSVYVSTYGGDIYRLNASTGNQQWKRGTVGNAQTSGVTVIGETVYAVVQWRSDSSYDGRDRLFVTAHSVDRGIQRWEKEIADNNWYDNHDDFYGGHIGAPVVDDGRVFATDPLGDQVHALDTGDGHSYWTADTLGNVPSAPAVAGDTVYVTDTRGKLYGLATETGAETDRRSIDGASDSPPVVVGDTVYVGTGNGTVQGFDRSGLSEELRRSLDAGLGASPVVAGRTMYAATTNGSVYALGSPIGNVTASRSVDGPAEPGGTVNVTVTLRALADLSGPAIDERIPDELTVVSQSTTPAGTFRDSESQWYWTGASDGATREVSYELEIPADADSGRTYELYGTTSAADGSPSVIDGDSTIQVATCPNVAIAGSDNLLSLDELQRATALWADNRIIPETAGDRLSQTHLQRLITRWQTDSAVSCGSP